MEEDKITVTGDNLCVSDLLHHTLPFRPIKLSMCSGWGTWYVSVYLVGMNKYNCTCVSYHADAQDLLRIAQHKNYVSNTYRCSSIHSITHSSRSQYAAYGGRHRFHFVSYTVDHSLLGLQAKFKVRMKTAYTHIPHWSSINSCNYGQRWFSIAVRLVDNTQMVSDLNIQISGVNQHFWRPKWG